ncbi:neutral zinc metallopeptidase [Nonomuraea sp. NPDC050536]|uniref:neutral zinc metallopeptidase n=1 Tax=Nonomuraea sp. NPDC050536 TaxID=3364366 RepID=UPI0037CAA487
MPPGPPGPPRGPWGPPPRRKKGMGAAGILGIVLGSVAALFVLMVVVGAVFKSASHQVYQPVALPTESSYDPYHPPTEYTPPPAETTQPTQPTDDSTPTQSPTQDPVNPPQQVTVNRTLKGNTLYRAGGLPKSTCPAGNGSIFSHSQLKALILKTGQCMSRVWGPALERQGIQFRAPNYAITPKGGRGACGDFPSPGSMVPFYCPRNNTIYASTSAMARGNGNARGYGEFIQWNGGIISMMAHEYGHHVQEMSGIMGSWWDKTLASSSQSAKLALSRRLELQATCLGGMWMRSVANSYPVSPANRNRLFEFYGQVGDYPGWPRDHGAPVNNNRWFRQGWLRNTAYQCNTWAADSSTTS